MSAPRIYLDGNSLGPPPAGVAEALRALVESQWRGRLVEAWEEWLDLPMEIGDLLARELLGAPAGSVIMSDSTTVNFYKLAAAALDARAGRSVIVTDHANFPTDRYVLEGLASSRALDIAWLEGDAVQGPSPADVAAVADDRTALVTLSHVAYRSGAIADMAAINRVAHAAGALALWDLSHSVGVLPIDLAGSDCDLAVGCTYKYLNGGPGSPAFLFVSPRLQGELRQPIWGWWGRRAQFEMGPGYDPAPGISSFTTGTPPIIALAAAALGVRAAAEAGIEALRARSLELTGLLIEGADRSLRARGFGLGSPREASKRGGHVLLTHPRARAISVALRRHAGVIGDFRGPDGLRFAPLASRTTRAEIEEALRRIAHVVDARLHEQIESDARVP